MGNFYRVSCDKHGLNYDKYFKEGNVERVRLSEFNIHNTQLLDDESTKEKIASLGDYGIPVPDYIEENVSTKVVKIIQSYTGM